MSKKTGAAPLFDISEGLKISGLFWMPMLVIPILITGGFLMMIYSGPPEMNLPMVGVIAVIFMLLFFASGIPIAFGLMAVSFIFICYLRGIPAGCEMLGKAWYNTVASYPWSPMMFFLLMGYVCFYAGLGTDLFNSANKFFGHYRGGLAISGVFACAGFGAVVGDTLSGSIAMTSIGLPEMRKYKYDDGLSIGTLCCAGTLGTLIPPSIAFIVYGVLAEQSIGKLFIAGIIPGIICTLCFVGVILLMTFLHPHLAPSAPKVPLKERFLSLRKGGPVGALFVLVIAGIYFGIFTPTEGGGIGAFGALFISVIMGRLSWKAFTDSLTEAAKFTAMAFTLLGGATMFGYLMAMSNVPYELAELISGTNLHPMVVLILMLLILFVLGCFIPSIPMILICVPIFLPIAKAFNWDLIWFGVLMALMFNMASITPPFGINLFVLKGVTGVPMTFMYRCVMPFVYGLSLTTAIVVLFPSLSTWLPSFF